MTDLTALDGAYVFTTERLRGRRWRADEVAALMDVYGDEEGARWVGDGLPITQDECEYWLGVTANNYTTRGYGMFALDDRGDDSQTIGFCGLVHPGQQPDAEIKYAFRRSHWGLGLASEMVPAVLAYGHSAFGLNKIIATVHPDNQASRRVLEKAGLVLETIDRLDDDDDELTCLYVWLKA